MEDKTWRKQMLASWKFCSCLLLLYFWYFYVEFIHHITGKLDEELSLGEGKRRRVRLFEGVQRPQQHFHSTLWHIIRLVEIWWLFTSLNCFQIYLMGFVSCSLVVLVALFSLPPNPNKLLLLLFITSGRAEEDSPVLQWCQTIEREKRSGLAWRYLHVVVGLEGKCSICIS